MVMATIESLSVFEIDNICGPNGRGQLIQPRFDALGPPPNSGNVEGFLRNSNCGQNSSLRLEPHLVHCVGNAASSDAVGLWKELGAARLFAEVNFGCCIRSSRSFGPTCKVDCT